MAGATGCGSWTKLFVPGRLCLLGEHSDWAGGFRRFNPEISKGCTIVCPTNQGIYGRTRPSNGNITITESTGVGTEFELNRGSLLKVAREGGFWSYVAGTCYTMLTNFEVGGLDIVIDREDLPIAKGLSSSAAVCVFVARCFSAAYNLRLSPRGLMELAYLGETVTPSKCGRMDQACAYGCAVNMTYDGDFLEVAPLDVGGDFHFVLVDLHGEKDTVRILSGLQEAFPTAKTEVHRGVQAMLGANNLAITARAREALAAGDAAALGAVMRESQQGMDRFGKAAVPDQLTAPKLHAVIESAVLAPLMHGAKGVGAGGDGTAQILCRSAEAQAEVLRLVEGELGLTGLPLTLFRTTSGSEDAATPAATKGTLTETADAGAGSGAGAGSDKLKATAREAPIGTGLVSDAGMLEHADPTDESSPGASWVPEVRA